MACNPLSPAPHCVWLCLAAFVAGAPDGLADARPPQPSSSSSSAHDDAKRHFERAHTLYKSGDLDTALAEFEAAYQSYPSPGVFYNIGILQKDLHRYPEAIATLERYLTEAKAQPKERVTEAAQLIAEMRAMLGHLVLTISPAGATVIIDGRRAGETPLAPVVLTPGHHVIELSAPDHEPLRKEVSIAAGQPLALTIELKAIPKTGQARITSSPSLSTIRVDGQLLGTGAVELDLPAGGHTVEVSAPGYQTQQRALVLAAGQNPTMAVELARAAVKTPVSRRWWLWTAIGTAVAGGVATAIAVPLGSRPAPAGVGTLSPGNAKVN